MRKIFGAKMAGINTECLAGIHAAVCHGINKDGALPPSRPAVIGRRISQPNDSHPDRLPVAQQPIVSERLFSHLGKENLFSVLNKILDTLGVKLSSAIGA